MQARKLTVDGAFEFTPTVYPDDRGLFIAPFQEQAFIDAVGHPLFPVAQTNHSRSRRGVTRGIHFTSTPPGNAKYAYCSSGRAVDIVVDVRVGSPTFGQWDAVQLERDSFRAVYLPLGTGHAFIALDDDTVMSYLLSSEYVADQELAISPLDPAIGLPVPADDEIVLSPRDRVAPTLAEAKLLGMLPDYAECLRLAKILNSWRPVPAAKN